MKTEEILKLYKEVHNAVAHSSSADHQYQQTAIPIASALITIWIAENSEKK